jgi:large subunit ribosomal protein L4
MDAPTFTNTGTKATTAAKLDKTVFGVTPKNHALLKQAYVTYLANGRENLAITRTRGLVRGGGKKPWRQKGTGRARVGSSRVPNWRGGGAVFAPTGDENYAKKIPGKARQLAMKQALSLAAQDKKLSIIGDFAPKDNKTNAAAKLLAKLGASGGIVLVVADKTPELARAVRNLPNVTLVQANYLNVYDTLNADHLICTAAALEIVTTRLKKEASHA